MPPTFALPPNTRSSGTADPPGDMNAVVNVLNSRLDNVFFINDYGADNTGTALSDTAWTACYADATAALATNSGALVRFGPGRYRFSVNTVSVTDQRIGLTGAGKAATFIYTTGSSGTIVSVTSGTGGGNACAPVSGFSVNGGSGGAGLTGMMYGDRPNGMLTDVTVSGCGGAGARGFWFHDNVNLSEGSFVVVNSEQNTVCFDFDKQNSGGLGSWDYSHFFLHMVCSTGGPGVSVTGLRISNGTHIYGGVVHLCGNILSNNAAFTATCIAVGNSTTDTAHLNSGQLNVAVECDQSTGSVFDMVVQGASGYGIIKQSGSLVFPNFGGTYSAGSVSAAAAITCSGYLSGPLFSSHGTLTALGTGSTLFTYVG